MYYHVAHSPALSSHIFDVYPTDSNQIDNGIPRSEYLYPEDGGDKPPNVGSHKTYTVP
jgi:hypothetical protein